MRSTTCLAVMLVAACQVQPTEKQEEATSKQRTASTHRAVSSEGVTPWRLRLDAARFFSRPATTWNEGALVLSAYALAVDTQRGLARVTVDVTVENPTDVQSEAVIELPIPPSAAITEAWLWVGDKPMKGLMLSSDKAQAIYDEIVSRRRDPLLVAWKSSDRLALSIFPIESKQRRRFKVTWYEATVADRQWVPSFHHHDELIGYPTITTVNGKEVTRDGDWIPVAGTAQAAAGPWRLETQETTRPGSIVVILDTSGPQGQSRDNQWRHVRELFDGLGGSPITVLAADWLITELGTVTTAAELESARANFMKIRSAGVFDQRQAVLAANKAAGDAPVIVVVGDLGTYRSNGRGPQSAAPLFAVGPEDWPHQAELVWATGGGIADSGKTLAPMLRPLIAPNDGDFEWFPVDSATGHLVWLGKRRGTPEASGPVSPLEALFLRAKLRRDSIAPNRIVSPRSSILVLESAEHYKQWGLEPPDSSAPILAGATQAIDTDNRAPGAGFAGSGSGTGIGYGRGFGTTSGGGARSRQAPAAQIRHRQVTVEGPLDKNIVRRFMRRYTPQIRYCYEKALLVDERLAGILEVGFAIEPTGTLSRISVTMPGPAKAASECIRQVLKRIKMPKPEGGGRVTVTQAFELLPGPASQWSQALKLVDEAAPGHRKKIAGLFGLPEPRGSIELGWNLAASQMRDYRTPATSYVVVAKLLKAGGADPRDIRRILSEGAARHPEVTAGVLEEWGFADDARRARDIDLPSPRGFRSSGTAIFR